MFGNHVPLRTPVPRKLSDELAKRVYYVSDTITSFSLVFQDDQVTAVDLSTTVDVSTEALARKLDFLITKDIISQRMSNAGVVWRSPHRAATVNGVFDRLLADGLVIEMAPGLMATGEQFTRLLDALDRKIEAIAKDGHGAAPYRYPTLIPTSSLHRGGYLDSFPQFLLTASRLHSDVDTYRDFLVDLEVAEDPEGAAPELLARHGEHSGMCLPPTMCFHTYHQLSQSQLDHDEAAFTARGKSFRFESRYSRSLERLWDFTIREIVFFGDEETVVGHRQRFMDATCAWVTELGLAAHLEVASDPFFCNDKTPERVLAQRLMALKYELRMPAEGGRTISVGSFNVHGSSFGSTFNIRLPDTSTAHSSCVGFGLERLAFAFLCKHGTDESSWPAQVRRDLDE